MKKTKKHPPVTNNNPPLIIDSNILAYLVDDEYNPQIIEIFDELFKKYDVKTSDITFYELVCKGTKDIKNIVDAIVENFEMYKVDREVLGFSALMNCIGIKGVGDSIIAATAFLNSSNILTTNSRHFPDHLFDELKSWFITKKTKGRTISLGLYLLKPNVKSISEKMSDVEYVKPEEEKNDSN